MHLIMMDDPNLSSCLVRSSGLMERDRGHRGPLEAPVDAPDPRPHRLSMQPAILVNTNASLSKKNSKKNGGT